MKIIRPALILAGMLVALAAMAVDTPLEKAIEAGDLETPSVVLHADTAPELVTVRARLDGPGCLTVWNEWFADGADQALALQIVDRTLPPLVAGPRVFPDVKLNQVETIDAGVFQASLNVFLDMVGRKAIVQPVPAAARPVEVLGWNLGGQIEPLVAIGAHDLPQQVLAVAVAVSPGGVQEITAQVHRALERP